MNERLEEIEKRLFVFDFDLKKSTKQMIAKVEMQNFRTYKGKKTFEFSTEEEIARLVVLFAPNGMGKTSFFDGVEWNLTGGVDRFNELGKKKSFMGEVVLRNKEADNSEKYDKAKLDIQSEMQEFLKQFQVNDIYRKLEPHDELKDLVSEFDFTDDGKPELEFHVADESGKTYPPEWYFSTAQLNAVAFSIFLGRALQARDVPIKSILIDDPIGHFDDMNIVGFVDLLRNILENTDRQLIISTHEERVFGLIQRKIPKDEYPVKYIDFRKI